MKVHEILCAFAVTGVEERAKDKGSRTWTDKLFHMSTYIAGEEFLSSSSNQTAGVFNPSMKHHILSIS
jgi:hypothetical protein